jgi:hypothetical protein
MSKWPFSRPPRSQGSLAEAASILASPARIWCARRSREFDRRVEICARLGFGQADVVVAVPDVWFDVETMADLGDVASAFRHDHGRRLAIAHEVLAADAAVLFRQARHPALPDRREPGGNRRGAGGRLRRHRRRYHLDRLDACGKPSESVVGRCDPALRGLPGARQDDASFEGCRTDRRRLRPIEKAASAGWRSGL